MPTSSRILVGDVRTTLARIPDDSVQCIVTSPPYFGLRDYGLAGSKQTTQRGAKPGGAVSSARSGLANKQRLMIPARVAIALQSDGWWLRDEIIWHKPNPMPGSQRDRTTPAHEMLYALTKSARYHYDIDAIKEPASQPRGIPKQSGQQKQIELRKQDLTGNRQYKGFNARYKLAKSTLGSNQGAEYRSPRSVWTIPTRPFKGAHFATFPPEIPRRCILAGSRPGDIVLDPFSGAGTTGLVAGQLGRSYIGVELNPAYAFMSARRLYA